MCDAAQVDMEGFEFRANMLPTSGVLEFRVRGVRGSFKSIACRRLSADKSVQLLAALRRIHAQLVEPNSLNVSREHFVVAARFAVFLETSSREIAVAYTSTDVALPLVILRHNAYIWKDDDELAVTILHELVHLFDVINGVQLQEDRAATSRNEAIHDLLCYASLGLGAPRNHWAFSMYPNLLPSEPP